MDDSVDSVISDEEIMVADLHIMQSMDKDGLIHVYDLSRSNDGSELEPSKALELLEFARASVLAPMIMRFMQSYEECEECAGCEECTCGNEEED